MSIGYKIQKLRLKNKLSQEDLAYQIGVSQSTIHEIECGKTKKIDFNLISKLCDFFNIDINYFIEKPNLKQIINDSGIGYLAENQHFNNSDKLIEKYEQIIKLKDELIKEKDFLLEILRNKI